MSGDRSDGEKQTAPNYFEHRSSGRSDVNIRAEVRESGAGNFHIFVLDLSQTGFRMRSLSYINPEKIIFLRMPGFAPLESKVMWSNGDFYGCEFSRPLHPAVLDHIVAKFPALRGRPAS